MQLTRRSEEIFRSNFPQLQKDWVFSVSTKFVLVCVLLDTAIIIWRFGLLPPSVPLWYSRPWGIDQLAHPLWIFVLPVASIMWHLINTLVALYVAFDHMVFRQVLFVTSLAVSLLSLVTVIQILFLVT